MHRVIANCLNIVNYFGRKKNLNEFEHQLYESSCRFLTEYFRFHREELEQSGERLTT